MVKTITFNLKVIEYEFWGERFKFSVPTMLLLAFVVGIIGGTCGIGGGAIIAPLLRGGIPPARLYGRGRGTARHVPHVNHRGFFYSVLPAAGGVSTSPDWVLGFLFGADGFAGMYIGARLQKYVPQKVIKLMLGIMIVTLALRYIMQFF